jgi:hypothetical protein
MKRVEGGGEPQGNHTIAAGGGGITRYCMENGDGSYAMRSQGLDTSSVYFIIMICGLSSDAYRS